MTRNKLLGALAASLLAGTATIAAAQTSPTYNQNNQNYSQDQSYSQGQTYNQDKAGSGMSQPSYNQGQPSSRQSKPSYNTQQSQAPSYNAPNSGSSTYGTNNSYGPGKSDDAASRTGRAPAHGLRDKDKDHDRGKNRDRDDNGEHGGPDRR
jgi:hypothetical protein